MEMQTSWETNHEIPIKNLFLILMLRKRKCKIESPFFSIWAFFSSPYHFHPLHSDDDTRRLHAHTHTLVGPSGSKQSNYVILPTARKKSITSYKHLIGQLDLQIRHFKYVICCASSVMPMGPKYYSIHYQSLRVKNKL